MSIHCESLRVAIDAAEGAVEVEVPNFLKRNRWSPGSRIGHVLDVTPAAISNVTVKGFENLVLLALCLVQLVEKRLLVGVGFVKFFPD